MRIRSDWILVPVAVFLMAFVHEYMHIPIRFDELMGFPANILMLRHLASLAIALASVFGMIEIVRGR